MSRKIDDVLFDKLNILNNVSNNRENIWSIHEYNNKKKFIVTTNIIDVIFVVNEFQHVFDDRIKNAQSRCAINKKFIFSKNKIVLSIEKKSEIVFDNCCYYCYIHSNCFFDVENRNNFLSIQICFVINWYFLAKNEIHFYQ